MTDKEHTPRHRIDDKRQPDDEEPLLGTHSRRSVLSSLGAGAATVALGSGAGSVAASPEDENAATKFADSESPDTVATADGHWSDSGIWDNGVPTDGDNVEIPQGTTVRLGGTTARVKTLDVAGTFAFDRTVDTELKAETIVTREASTFHVGTESNPIARGSTAKITFVHHEDISEKDDPTRVSKGLVTIGDTEIHGAEKSGWHTLATAPESGDTQLELVDTPTGWRAGDTLVVPGMNPDHESSEDEEVTIKSISGTSVTLSRSLNYDHTPPATDLGTDFDAYVVNLTRNVLVESEIKATDPTDERRVNRQGHVMIMQAGSAVHNARFRHVGRTNKRYYFTNPKYGADSVPSSGEFVADAPNPRKRYGFHYHETGIEDGAKHEASGLVVQDSPGWGIVNHHSHADVTDSVTYRVLGAGFVAEGGDERGSFTRNFALRSRGSGQTIDARQAPNEDVVDINDFGHAGNGFWLQGPAVTVENNVAAGHRSYAFAIWDRPLYDEDEFDVTDFRTHRGDTANIPLTYVQDLLSDPMRDVLDPGELTSSRVSTSHIQLRSVTDNTAFASAGGIDIANHNFDNPIGPVSVYSRIEGFTGYNFSSFVDSNGDELYPTRSGNNWGLGGNTGISVRYSNNILITDATLVNDGSGHGVRRNFYPRNGAVRNSSIEGFDVGIHTIDTGDGEIDGVTFENIGAADIDVTSLGDIGALDIDISNIDFSSSGSDIALEDNWTVFIRNRFSENGPNLSYEGQTIYFEEQAPDFVPYPNEAEVDRQIANSADWNDLFGLSGRQEAKDELVGLTNRQLKDQYGECIYGELLPASAVDDPHIDGGKLESSNQGPTPSFTTNSSGLTVEFDAGDSVDPDGSITSYEWTFGDGDSASGETVDHTYGSADDYDVTLTVTDDDGRTASTTETVSLRNLRSPDNPGSTTNGIDYTTSFGESGTTDQIDLEPFRNGGLWKDSVTFTGYVEAPQDGNYTFSVTADNRATLSIGDTEVVRDTLDSSGASSGTIGLEAGLHEITVEYYEQFGSPALDVAWDGPGVQAGEVPASALYVVGSSSDLQDPVEPGPTTNGIDYTTSFGESGTTDQMDLEPFRNGGLWKDSVTFTGYVEVPDDGEYTFSVTADNRATLSINGSAVVTDTLDSSGASSGTVGLKTGYHEITVEYYEQFGSPALKVAWDGPGVSAGEVPASALYVSSSY